MLNKVEDIYPLSPMQQGMLFHSLLEREAGIYFDQLGCRIKGGIDTDAFRRAWEQVAERHAILRSCFVWEGVREPVQAVVRKPGLRWHEEDWSDCEAGERDQRWREFLADDRDRGFDLKKAPLMRFALVKAGDAEHYFAWSYHHILLDGWCHKLLLKEVSEIYAALKAGRPLQLPAPPKYRDYIAWLQKQSESKAEEFWRKELKGLSAPTRLGIELDNEKSGRSKDGFAEASIDLCQLQTQELTLLARDLRVTLNTIVQGAWAILLSHYSGEDHVSFGATVSGRGAAVPGIESMVGLFINTLPVHVEVSATGRIDDYLLQLQARQAEARNYEYSPLVKVQSWSEIPRGAPLFHHILLYDQAATGERNEQEAGGWFLIDDLETSEVTNYPLFLTATAGNTLSFCCKYKLDSFCEYDVNRLLEHLRRIIEQIIRNPKAQIGEVSFIDSLEEQQLLVGWNDTAQPSTRKCLGELFEEQAEARPQSVAVEFAEEQLTFAELNGRANQLAHYLQRSNIGIESRVGVCLERGMDLIVAMIAILKLGAVYVPLDATNPRRRLEYLSENAGIEVLITNSRQIQNAAIHASQIVQLDKELDRIKKEKSSNPGSQVSPANLAYMIYTSGSTGRSKGVMGTHEATANRLSWIWRQYPFHSNEVCCQKTSIGFVDSIAEILMPLLAGVKMVIIPDTAGKDPRALIEILGTAGVSRIVLVPSLLSAMLDALSGQEFLLPSLRLWTSSGESLTSNLRDRFYKELPGRTLLNLYGSAEVAADATWIDTEEHRATADVSIGRPIGNIQVYVLDQRLTLLPIGVEGELYVGGKGLARGYRNRPDLTAERFLPNPFSKVPGERMYRTGDRARWRRDGTLEYVGRRDRQIKIRGHRIELDEIETALKSHDAVSDAAVVIHRDESGEEQIMAYIVAVDLSQQPGVRTLRNHLRELLPTQMLPANFHFLDAMPLTSGGKIDRMHLPKPELQQQEYDVADIPRNELELQVALLWQEFLKISNIGRRQSFFDLGGHSISAISLLNKIKKHFGVDIALPDFVEDPTVEHLAALLKDSPRPKRVDNIVPIQRNGARRPLFLVHATGGGPMDYVGVSRLLPEDQPLYAFQSKDEEEVQIEPFLSIPDRAANYITALRQIQPKGPYLLGGWSFGAFTAFEMAQQLVRQGESVAALILIDIQAEVRRDLPEYYDDAEFLLDFVNFQVKAPAHSSANDSLGDGFTLNGCKSQFGRARIEYLTRQLTDRGILSPDVQTSQVEVFAKACRKRELALSSYKLNRYAGGVHLIRASDSGLSIPMQSIDPEDVTRGFGNICKGAVRVHFVPGNHLTMLRAPHLEDLAAALGLILEECSNDVQHGLQLQSELVA